MISYIFIIALTSIVLIHWFLYSRLVRALNISSPVQLWILRIVTVCMALSYFASRMREDRFPEWITSALSWISSLWLGLIFELFWITLFFYLIKLVLRLSGQWKRFSLQSKNMLGKYSFIAVLATSILLCGYGMYRAWAPARIVNLQVPVKNITPELRNLKIVMASDWHIGILVSEKELRQRVAQINSLQPDLILLPGDIVDRRGTKIFQMAAILRELRATYGVFGSTGNHEYYAGLKPALDFLQSSNIHMLQNQHVILPNGLIIAGTEDQTAGRLGKVLPSVADVIGEDALSHPTILLHHQPRPASDVTTTGVDLMLSGHTHGGQIWPFRYLSRLVFPMDHGLYDLGNGHHLYSSCGIGYWGPPMRIGAPPEIINIRLIGADEKAVNITN